MEIILIIIVLVLTWLVGYLSEKQHDEIKEEIKELNDKINQLKKGSIMNYEQKHPILQKLEEYFKNTPKEQIDKDWSNILKDTDSEAYYEEKYKEALERARDVYIYYCDDREQLRKIESIFPELAESEDERVRKEIISFLKDFEKDHYRSVNFNSWIAWLEKQGETNKVEPKFKVGNWYQCTKDFFGKGVTFDKNTAYYCAKEGCLQNEYGCHIAIVKDLYNNFKLWTIQDAKAGDVLYSIDSKQPFIYKERPQFSQARGYCCINKFGEFAIWNTSKCVICTDKYIPATKEQRDLLFRKMEEAGYEWDANKKELKKIEPKALDPNKVIEWLNHHELSRDDVVTSVIPDDSPTSSPHRAKWFSDEFIKQFKKDFGL